MMQVQQTEGSIKARNEGFSQVCVWPGTLVGKKVAEFEAFMLDTFQARVQYLEEIATAPDTVNGVPVNETGGRSDLFFAVHSADIGGFAVPRLQYGIRWIEDVLDNEARRGEVSIYPKYVTEYRTW